MVENKAANALNTEISATRFNRRTAFSTANSAAVTDMKTTTGDNKHIADEWEKSSKAQKLIKGDKSTHNNMPASPVHTPHVRTTQTWRAIASASPRP